MLSRSELVTTSHSTTSVSAISTGVSTSPAMRLRGVGGTSGVAGDASSVSLTAAAGRLQRAAAVQAVAQRRVVQQADRLPGAVDDREKRGARTVERVEGVAQRVLVPY